MLRAQIIEMRCVNNYSFDIIKFPGSLKRSLGGFWKRKPLTCKCQLSPMPTYELSSKTETSATGHESLLQSLSLHQGVSNFRWYDNIGLALFRIIKRRCFLSSSFVDDDCRMVAQSRHGNHLSAIGELVEKIKKTLRKPSSQRSKMILIDTIQRLGVGHYFEDEIRVLLEGLANHTSGENLFNTALCFRLMRHNGLPTSSDAFDKFINKNGKFKGSLRKDMRGILSLYEALHLSAKGEEKLLKAMEFTRSHLEHSMPSMSPDSRANVAKVLELPRHLRMATLEARNYIDQYSHENNHIPTLLALAKFEFNELQSLYKKDLTEIVRWWNQLGLVDKLDFARDRPFECFLWTVGIFPEASYSNIRIELAKTVCILLVIDDIYDSYGSLPELVLFTDAIKRWELSAIEKLPEYMRICYMALYNTTNEIAYRVLKEHRLCIASELKRTWIDKFEAFLTEAEWYNSKYKPSLEQYLKNGVTSGGSYMALVHSFFLIGQVVTNETTSMMNPYPELFSCCGKILRLWDDLETAKEEKERGDVASSIECYMKENNVECEDEARKHIKKLIGSLWLALNGHFKSPNALPNSITKACLNLARTSQVIYQHGDDNTFSSVDDHVKSLFFRPCK